MSFKFDCDVQWSCHAPQGYDGIPIEVYKEYFHFLGPVITKICNSSLILGIFPSKLAIAKVKCLFKAGNRNIIRNYRSISIRSSFSKILVEVVTHQLVHYFESNAILNSSQFGFRTNRSTELAYHTVVRKIYSNFDSGIFTLRVFLDPAKAFDSLDRRLLFEKLKHYGIRDVVLEWFKGYLF